MKLAILALLGLAGTPLAQEVTFLGKVEDVQGTANQFVLDCNGASLSSTLFDLNLFVGQQVEITGQWNGSFFSPAVVVESIQSALENFEIGGGAKIGETSRLGFTGTPGDTAVGFLSTGSGFFPVLGNSAVFLIDPTEIRLTSSGVIGGAGILEIPFLIPNNAALIGVDMFGQGAFVAPDGTITLTNPDCKQISD